MSFTVEQKSQLAKLLATENLTVQHQKISTAKFDVKNRVLYLPIWQNMTGVIYDLLVGHEVGHALYTPAEGWHDAVTDEDKNRNYKHFLNVVEDARIEKKVKRKYPGLNVSFRNAYQELNNRDFFGLDGRDVNAMPFVDRLNIFSKSQWTATGIDFTEEEELLIKEVQAAETWEDVVRITDKVYEYSKTEQQEMNPDQYDQPEAGGDGDGDDDVTEEYGESDSDDSDDSDDGEQTETDDEDDEEGSDSERDNKFNREKTAQPTDEDLFDPKCETDENYRKNETKLLDEKCKEFVYLDIPKPNLSDIVTPAKRVQELLTMFYDSLIQQNLISADEGMKLVNQFKNRNERYVGLLAKEFEMRKAAKSFSKSKLSDTGDIDINKLSSYKFDDNIFRKVMLTPKGKSHGLVLLLDRSGSMSRNMAGSIEQILVLSMFCRKVNIPFIVYGFTDSDEARRLDMNLKTDQERIEFYQNLHGDKGGFTKNLGELRFGQVYLREYLTSQMTNAEFSIALKNMCLLMESYKNKLLIRPNSEKLGNTPMIEAVVASAEIIKDFKRKNNLDICSLVIVHDGDADHLGQYFGKIDKKTDEKITPLYVDRYANVNFLRDRKNKFEYKISSDRFYESMTIGILNWFRKVTDVRVFGFFIVSNGTGNIKHAMYDRYVFEGQKSYFDLVAEVGQFNADEKLKELIKQFKDAKFLASKLPGYDSFFLIHGGSELSTDDEEFEVDGTITAKKLATAFTKYNKKRAVNRVLVSRFIQGIAA